MAKGIRVNQLAKDLGVSSKAILDKCKAEGLGEKVPQHMSLVSVGLAETIKEWFTGQGGVATAVEEAAPVEAAVKTRKRPVSRSVHEESIGDTAVVVEPPAREHPIAPEMRAHERHAPEHPAIPDAEVHAPAPAAPAHVAAPPVPAVDETPAAPSTPVTAPPEAESHDTPTVHTEPHAPAHGVTHGVTHGAPHGIGHGAGDPAAPAIAAEAPGSHAGAAPAQPAGHAHARGHAHGPDAGRMGGVVRPTVSINQQRPAPPPPPVKKPVTVAPQLTSLAPATIQGPKVVRVESPDVVSAPRRPRQSNEGSTTPGYITARPQAGRGVKVVEDESEESAEARKKAAAKGGPASRTNSGRRRGSIDGRRGEAQAKIKEFSEQDLAERRKRIAESAKHRRDFDSHLGQVERRGTHAIAKTTVQKGEPVEIEEPITVRSLAAVLGIKGNDILGKLMRQGVRDVTINSTLDTETAETMALEYGLELQIVQQATLEEELEAEMNAREVAPENLQIRPPVVTILGHVDHGKTSLLDKIRHANVAAGEAGGITQHTAAWMVTIGEGDAAKRVTFIDTPGHQAFTKMRARGADMTDVVVLVVGATEGVQPQTIESINHARAADVPIVVAMNKIDRPDANPDMVLGQLAAQGLNPVEWGGDTEVIRTSAVTGQGIPELIEILDYQSQLLELKADPTAPARGIVIEAAMDDGLGPVATVLVQDGTLKVGDVMLSGAGYGRIRGLFDDRRKPLQGAGPSTPVIVSGLDRLPSAGDKFYTLDDIERARSIAEERGSMARAAVLSQRSRVTASNLFAEIAAGQVQTINLIIKGDVQGSVETLTKSVTDANTDEVKVKVIHSGVGAINESDVELAMATRTKPTDNKVAIIGFHVVAEEAARQLAEQHHIDVKLYKVIYEIFDDLKKALSGMLTPEEREKLHGHAEIRMVIKASKIGNVAGCFVTDGHIQRGSKIRLSRGGVVVTEDLNIDSLRRVKDDVREVKAGLECGIKLAGYDDIKIGDVLEAYIRETFERTL